METFAINLLRFVLTERIALERISSAKVAEETNPSVKPEVPNAEDEKDSAPESDDDDREQCIRTPVSRSNHSLASSLQSNPHRIADISPLSAIKQLTLSK